MRFLATCVLVASTLSAQSLTTTFVSNNGQSGNMFDVVANLPVVITGLDVHLIAGTWNLELYQVTGGGSFVGLEATPGAWTLIGSATGVVSNGPGVGTPLPIPINLPLAPSQTQGFYVTLTNGGTMNYTDGTTLGAVYAQDAFLQILEGKGVAYPFAGSFSPRIWNGTVYYQPGGSGTFASNTTIGAGCGARFASFYEQWAMSAFDLANRTVTWLNTGSGYTVLDALPGTFVPPTASATNVAPGLLDGQQSFPLPTPMPSPTGPVNALNVTTKGQIELNVASSTIIDYTPTAAELLAWPSTVFACWHDYDQTATGSGLITFEVVGSTAYVTWNGVYSYLTTTPNTLQFQFDLANGNVTLVIGAMSGAASQDQIVVGYSPAGASLDPGASDLSVALATTLQLEANDVAALRVTASTRPLINTAWNLSVDNIPASTVLGVTIVGLSDPGLNDLAVLGLPGCGLRASLDLLTVFLPAGASHAFSLPLPNDTGLLGVNLFTSGAAFTSPPVNAFGAITANAVRGTIGNL